MDSRGRSVVVCDNGTGVCIMINFMWLKCSWLWLVTRVWCGGVAGRPWFSTAGNWASENYLYLLDCWSFRFAAHLHIYDRHFLNGVKPTALSPSRINRSGLMLTLTLLTLSLTNYRFWWVPVTRSSRHIIKSCDELTVAFKTLVVVGECVSTLAATCHVVCNVVLFPCHVHVCRHRTIITGLQWSAELWRCCAAPYSTLPVSWCLTCSNYVVRVAHCFWVLPV